MALTNLTSNRIRQDFIDFFVDKSHTFVPSSSLVPGGDQTLLFTNAGMVQFKDIFLDIDKRPYTRAANSQKCMRVAGKHNDLEDVGRNDTHHTFFEMLGNWSFGDYYKKEAIAWAWELLTERWGLPREYIWATCFRDDQGDIPTDDEAAGEWLKQPGMDPSHILFFGRKDNFWEMADTGPSGPCSEIHFERGPEYCDRQGSPDHICQVNGDCPRFLELWNLVFIQYNRQSPTELEPLPSKHVDTGMGFERIVSLLQNVDSNYKTDLFKPMMDTIQHLSVHSEAERAANLTPYRVIADHARAAAFLIADGVIPGNTGRNYVCRMIIRRAARFGSEIGLDEPFLSAVAETIIDNYGEFYPELLHNHTAIVEYLTGEEKRFQRTLDSGLTKLETLFEKLRDKGASKLPGDQAFDLYSTHGMPLEITRDIAREQGLDVDEDGFHKAMEEHRRVSKEGVLFAVWYGRIEDVYRSILEDLQKLGKLGSEGVIFNPYKNLEVEGQILSIVRVLDKKDEKYKKYESVKEANPGDNVEILLPKTCFYVEAGGQVSDTGTITSAIDSALFHGEEWEVRVDDTRQTAAGLIVHAGEVIRGIPKTGDQAIARVDVQRRLDIIRNHTATHLMHAELRAELGEHARQAGSLVAPDRLRFDFTHPEAVTPEQLERIEARVNRAILGNYPLNIAYKPLQQAIEEGAIALFGEKYAESVRNITISRPASSGISSQGQLEIFSNELCGGTHVEKTGDIGVFLITSESSAAAGIRRVEAVTGREAYELIQVRIRTLTQTASLLGTTPELVLEKVRNLVMDLTTARKQISSMRQNLVAVDFNSALEKIKTVAGVNVLTTILPGADAATLRQMIDNFRLRYPTNGVAVLATISEGGRPTVIAAVTEDLVERGLHAGELVKYVAKPLGGSGGGKPTMAQAGGKNASKLEGALAIALEWVEKELR